VSWHPVLFELLPAHFTIPQLQNLYEAVCVTRFDNRNFSRKVLSAELLIKLREKDKPALKKVRFIINLIRKNTKPDLEAL
jgi:8-oxo-dGTP diphosphatase